MATCKNCGNWIRWEKRAERWVPFDDHGDHREHCTVASDQMRAAARLQNHERRVAQFLALRQTPKSSVQHRSQGVHGRTTATHVYCGDIPPWDDSLGEFRNFTDVEKRAGVVCRLI